MNRASLGHVLNALAAVHVMVAAQFGPSHLTGEVLGGDEFRLTKIPEWPLENYYTRPMHGAWELGNQYLGYDKWTAKKLGL